MGRFFEVLFGLAKGWSYERNESNQNQNVFMVTPSYDLNLMTTGYNWIRKASSMPYVIQRKVDGDNHDLS